MNYINISKKKIVGRNNNAVSPLQLDYSTVTDIPFQFLNDNNQIQPLLDNLSGLYIAGAKHQNAPSSGLLFLSMDYTISANVLTFSVDTYTQNYLDEVKKSNTDIFIEIGQIDQNNQKVLLRDHAIANPRVYTDGLSPTIIDSDNYYTKAEIDDIIPVIPSGGQLGQVLCSDGNGGLTWMTIQ